MSDWIDNRQPPENVTVEVMGSGCTGNWTSTAMRVNYKPGSSKAHLKKVWRWMKDGNVFDDFVEAWRLIE